MEPEKLEYFFTRSDSNFIPSAKFRYVHWQFPRYVCLTECASKHESVDVIIGLPDEENESTIDHENFFNCIAYWLKQGSKHYDTSLLASVIDDPTPYVRKWWWKNQGIKCVIREVTDYAMLLDFLKTYEEIQDLDFLSAVYRITQCKLLCEKYGLPLSCIYSQESGLGDERIMAQSPYLGFELQDFLSELKDIHDMFEEFVKNTEKGYSAKTPWWRLFVLDEADLLYHPKAGYKAYISAEKGEDGQIAIIHTCETPFEIAKAQLIHLISTFGGKEDIASMAFCNRPGCNNSFLKTHGNKKLCDECAKAANRQRASRNRRKKEPKI